MDTFIEGLGITLTGIFIVFLILTILWAVLMLMKVIFDKSNQKSATKVSNVVEQKDEIKEKDEIEDDELIAVLTSAVAASLNTSTYNLKIKSYRRIDDKVPVWNKVGRKEQIENSL